MLAIVRTATIFGIEAYPVCVEVDVSDAGLPAITLVGLPDASVRESRERVQSAIRNSGFDFPRRHVTVNLAPANIRKVGSAFDLPIALGVLAATGLLPTRQFEDTVVLGELSLDGAVRSVAGALPISAQARRDGARSVILPRANAGEAALVSGLKVVPVVSLEETVAILTGRRPQPTHPKLPATPDCATVDLVDVRGQALARRAIEIAAAGGHNLLLIGPPGAGKSMLARRLPSILPPLTFDEALEVTAIHSVAGLLHPGASLLTAPPFRAPHHTASDVALVGGGPLPRPGEITLAQNGVLLLDETAEFARHALDALRQPLEEGTIRIARAARTAVFPARFMLAATMNPCNCGYLGDPARACRCTPQQIDRYRGRLSGPLRDRIDLSVWVPAVPFKTMTETAPGESSACVRQRVTTARARQTARNRSEAGTVLNARLQGRALTRHCALDPAGLRVLDAASRRFHLSARSCHRLMKVARTIADLADAERIAVEHLAEAVQFRLEGN
ncbi:MAG: YifB family Mg chelatase-like AAA ATPase [Vicinamibacterales bacterium]|jgi:magnesium chelatase family protein|nr:YifB family Mg chelatase-like AAA ATPase [Vicinamibacterales bacterium]